MSEKGSMIVNFRNFHTAEHFSLYPYSFNHIKILEFFTSFKFYDFGYDIFFVDFERFFTYADNVVEYNV